MKEKLRTVFLSRATNEFGPMVNPLRRAAEQQYPMLEVTDQLFPPSPAHELTAVETVRHLRAWLDKVDVVMHFAGACAGAACKVPQGGFNGLLSLLDSESKRLLEELAKFFDQNGTGRDKITYTQLEGVLAIANSRPLYVLRLSLPDQAEIEPSQRLYRQWLEERHLGGRERCDGTSIEVLVAAAHRKLAEWNERSRMERLARSTHEVTLWETILEVSQPGAARNEVETRWREVLHYEADSEVDWICGHLACEEPPTGVIYKSMLPAPEWLIPAGKGAVSLGLMEDGWHLREYELAGNLRAVCHDGAVFWVLCEPKDLGACVLAPADQKVRLLVAGLHLHHFGVVHLWHAQAAFHVVSGGSAWTIEMPTGTAPDCRVMANACLMPSEKEEADSKVLPQFPRSASFPFRRHFRGETYEYGLARQDAEGGGSAGPWALISWRGRLHHLVFRAGEFTDVFKTVDVKLAGKWDLNQVVLQNGVHWLKVTQGQARLLVPLHHACTGDGRMVICDEIVGQDRIPLLRRAARMDLAVICAENDLLMAPFCFVARDIAGEPVTETRLRVWLIPASPTTGVLKHLRGLLCEVEMLPETPFRSVSDSAELLPCGLDDGWWSQLWNECRMQWEPR